MVSALAAVLAAAALGLGDARAPWSRPAGFAARASPRPGPRRPTCAASAAAARVAEPGPDNCWHREWVMHLDASLRGLTGTALLPTTTPGAGECGALAHNTDLVVVSHGTEAEPLFNYASAAALELWEVDWAAFVSLESRASAESVEREERAALLARVTADGYIADYRGMRISSSGKRFEITDAIVWNVYDGKGSGPVRSRTLLGQAAMFSRRDVRFFDTG